MATNPHLRWLTLRGGEQLPRKRKARAKRLQTLNRHLARLNGPVTTRQATPEELASLR